MSDSTSLKGNETKIGYHQYLRPLQFIDTGSQLLQTWNSGYPSIGRQGNLGASSRIRSQPDGEENSTRTKRHRSDSEETLSDVLRTTGTEKQELTIPPFPTSSKSPDILNVSAFSPQYSQARALPRIPQMDNYTMSVHLDGKSWTALSKAVSRNVTCKEVLSTLYCCRICLLHMQYTLRIVSLESTRNLAHNDQPIIIAERLWREGTKVDILVSLTGVRSMEGLLSFDESTRRHYALDFHQGGDLSMLRKKRSPSPYGRIYSNSLSPPLESCFNQPDWVPGHGYLRGESTDPFTGRVVLGSGSIGVVEEVKLKLFPEGCIVRKRVTIPLSRKDRIAIVRQEADILRRLSHPHIIRVLGSYEDGINPRRYSYCLLMSPVGDDDLRSLLESIVDPVLLSLKRGWIRQWFFCLLAGLQYMHDQGIRHQDIKPSNIIHKGDRIYFTDFSSSCSFELGSTTSTDEPARCSAMYGAPEVVDKFLDDGSLRKHGRGSDIFSLGCVFCEMYSILLGKSVSSYQKFLLEPPASSRSEVPRAMSGPTGALLYSRKLHDISRWFEGDTFFEACISPMLATDRRARPEPRECFHSMRRWGWKTDSCQCFSGILGPNIGNEEKPPAE